MEYYYIHKFFCDILDRKFKRCKHCDKTIWKSPIYYKEYPICSYHCLTNFYEDNYIITKKIDARNLFDKSLH
jgi:hypothetical protein